MLKGILLFYLFGGLYIQDPWIWLEGDTYVTQCHGSNRNDQQENVCRFNPTKKEKEQQPCPQNPTRI